MKLAELLNIISETANKNNTSTPRICGGVARDFALNKLSNVSDLDITTGDNTVHMLSSELAKILRKSYSIKEKTSDDGHTSIFLSNLKLDFSSNFNAPNINEYLNKLNISNPTEMQKEMYSRDFTVNALLLDLDLKKIYDPTNLGLKDIKSKIIKTCLDPKITLTVNKNRVIRSIYLAAKLDFEIDKAIIEFVKNNPNSVYNSTHKLLNDKLNEALKYNSDKTKYYLNEMGLNKLLGNQ